jgi:hypothetical protein
MTELRQRHSARLSEFASPVMNTCRPHFRPARPLSRHERIAVRIQVGVWRRLRPVPQCVVKQQIDHIIDMGKLAGCRSAQAVVAFHLGSADHETRASFGPMFGARWY